MWSQELLPFKSWRKLAMYLQSRDKKKKKKGKYGKVVVNWRTTKMGKRGEIKIIWLAKMNNQRIRKSFLVLKMIVKLKISVEVLEDEVNDPKYRAKNEQDAKILKGKKRED